MTRGISCQASQIIITRGFAGALGMTMSRARSSALLRWAKECDGLTGEDDDFDERQLGVTTMPGNGKTVRES
ncbi:hypothetical protein ACQPT2_18380 [Erwinia amylovora]